MIFGLYVYEVLQNILKTVLGWKYIVLFIGLFVCSSTKIMCRIIYLQGEKCPHILDVMITGIPICELLLFFIFLKEKNAKTSFRLDIKHSNIFLHKKCRFCILLLKNIATIPLLPQLPETLRNPLANG